jgi:uncharacterized protein (TIGR02391 family)
MFLDRFERLVRRAGQFTDEPNVSADRVHPFDLRSIHPSLPSKVRRLFDDGYYAEASFEAFKFLDKVVARNASSTESGQKLMMQAFADNGPLAVADVSTTTGKDEQSGYRFIFAGVMAAFRNSRGHEVDMADDAELTLDHLAVASTLLRRLDQAGYVTNLRRK